MKLSNDWGLCSMMKRFLSFFLGAALIVVLAVPVSASQDSGWTELLEVTSVLPDGDNWFTLSGTTSSLTIPLPTERRLRKVDMLIWNPTGARPTSASVSIGNSSTTLEVVQLGSNMFRVFGYVPSSFYKVLTVTFKRSSSTSATYELLSCKVTTLGDQEFALAARAEIEGTTFNCPFSMESVGTDTNVTYPLQFPVIVTDWEKYDSITITGSVGQMALNSIRCTIGNLGLPYEMTYTSSNDSGGYGNSYAWSEHKYYSYDDSYKGSTEEDSYFYTTYSGKTLFTITVDLTGVDRTVTADLYIFFTGLCNDAEPFSVQIVGATGSVVTADTSSVSWWFRFTSFMTDLFGSDDGQDSLNALDQSADSISQGAADIHNFEQSQQAVLNSGFSTIQSAVSFTSFSAALLFVQKYANLTVSGISKYMVVFTLPLFLGLFFYLCSRVPGITRWKPRPPQKKGGKSP